MSSLPSLDIVAENIQAMQAIYYAYQLEQMCAFQVVERIVELYQQGLLPLGAAPAGQALQCYWQADDRLTALERADLYARAFGAPGGQASEGETDDDFLSLWLRFITSVAMYSIQRTVDPLLVPPTSAHARLRDAARALAVNASAHGAALTTGARRLSADVSELLALLRDPEIVQAFGARDMWQVIDQVNTLELGGPVNVTRYRTRAQAGSVILQWLAAHADTLRRPAVVTTNVCPDDADLVQAVAQWLAVSGIQDTAVDQLAHPDASECAATSPIDLPAVAQDLLQAAGLSVGNDPTAGSSKGVVLFCGPAGSGKTLAAYVVAEALSLSILRVDLSRVVSKYIGDTEKYLGAVFADARESGAILFFDEADALFAKRTEVQDSHDRYANLEIAHLPQRIESHDGLVILASNEPAQPDDAFADERWCRLVRRIVRFPLPWR
jgi:hypothetical protein